MALRPSEPRLLSAPLLRSLTYEPQYRQSGNLSITKDLSHGTYFLYLSWRQEYLAVTEAEQFWILPSVYNWVNWRSKTSISDFFSSLLSRFNKRTRSACHRQTARSAFTRLDSIGSRVDWRNEKWESNCMYWIPCCIRRSSFLLNAWSTPNSASEQALKKNELLRVG
jgi:hypothetical protein